jgi:hypothetical protein
MSCTELEITLIQIEIPLFPQVFAHTFFATKVEQSISSHHFASEPETYSKRIVYLRKLGLKQFD